jgi:hypothetical protein
MDIERMLLLKERVLAEPEHYEQNTWGQNLNSLPDSFSRIPTFHWQRTTIEASRQPLSDKTMCGVACCLAGTSVAISDPEKFCELLTYTGIASGYDFIRHAANWLDLTERQADTLFSLASEWPEPFNDRYRYATTLEERAVVGADMIDYVIANAEALASHAPFEIDSDIPF